MVGFSCSPLLILVYLTPPTPADFGFYEYLTDFAGVHYRDQSHPCSSQDACGV